MRRSISLTIKPTNSCNFRCKHCFNGESLENKEILPLESVLKILNLASEKYNEIKVTFHGGEPSLVGKNYYRQIFEHIRKLEKDNKIKFFSIFQTNGYLLDDEFIDILIENKSLISISFDGPHNDVLRSHSKSVYNSIKKVQEKRGRLRVFCVETSKSMNNLISTYEWFKSEGIDYKILPIQPRGFAEGKDDLALDIDKYIEKLIFLYRYWLKDKESDITVGTLKDFLLLRKELTFKPMWFDRKLSLNSDGKLYPFGRPYDINFCLGDPYSIKDIDECFNSSEYSKLKATLIEKIEETCKNCKAYDVCNGTCLCSSFVYGNDPKMLKYACNLAEKTFINVIKINEEVIKDIASGNKNKYSKNIVDYFVQQDKNERSCTILV